MPSGNIKTQCNVGGSRSKSYRKIHIEGKQYLLHRVVYCGHHGLSLADIEGKVVRHTCDNPPCVNPAHLVLGSQAENMQDKVLRNRQGKTLGVQNHTAVLTPGAVQRIEKALLAGETQQSLAEKFYVSQTTISNISRNKAWKHTPRSSPVVNRRRGSGNRLAKLTVDDVLAIRAACSSRQKPQKQIAKEYGITPSLVSMIYKRKAWSHVA